MVIEDRSVTNVRLVSYRYIRRICGLRYMYG